MSQLTIGEIQKRRKLAQKTITSILRDLEQSTGMQVEGVELEYYKEFGKQHRELKSAEITMKINGQ